jgi:hypothetical protein
VTGCNMRAGAAVRCCASPSLRVGSTLGFSTAQHGQREGGTGRRRDGPPASTCARTCTHTQARTHAQTRARTHAHTQTRTSAQTDAHTLAHTRTHAHTHLTQTHT